MRFVKFMKEDVTDALEVNEPEVGKKYSDEYVSKRIDIIQNAIKKVRGQKMNDDAKEAIMADLNDKLDKWENVDKETKPVPIAGPEAPPETPQQDEIDPTAEPLERGKEDTEDMKQELIDKKGVQQDKEKDIENQKKEKDVIKKDADKKEDEKKKLKKTESVRLIKTRIR